MVSNDNLEQNSQTTLDNYARFCGRKAYDAGKGWHANPFSRQSHRHALWAQGYNEAYNAAYKAKHGQEPIW